MTVPQRRGFAGVFNQAVLIATSQFRLMQKQFLFVGCMFVSSMSVVHIKGAETHDT